MRRKEETEGEDTNLFRLKKVYYPSNFNMLKEQNSLNSLKSHARFVKHKSHGQKQCELHQYTIISSYTNQVQQTLVQ